MIVAANKNKADLTIPENSTNKRLHIKCFLDEICRRIWILQS